VLCAGAGALPELRRFFRRRSRILYAGAGVTFSQLRERTVLPMRSLKNKLSQSNWRVIAVWKWGIFGILCRRSREYSRPKGNYGARKTTARFINCHPGLRLIELCATQINQGLKVNLGLGDFSPGLALQSPFVIFCALVRAFKSSKVPELAWFQGKYTTIIVLKFALAGSTSQGAYIPYISALVPHLGCGASFSWLKRQVLTKITHAKTRLSSQNDTLSGWVYWVVLRVRTPSPF
jgi:hypothetical protein